MWFRVALLVLPAVGASMPAQVNEAIAAAAAALESPKYNELPLYPYPAVDASDTEAAVERLLQDGVVLMRSRPTFPEARDVLDEVMERMGLARNSMCLDGQNGSSLNPWNDSDSISPLRIAFTDSHILAPADNSAQGPHQEGLVASRNNRRFIAFYCEEPSEEGGETALFDMHRAWQLLAPDLQERFKGSDFGNIYAGEAGSPAEMRTCKVPAVVLHPHSHLPCFQFYCFGRAARDCIDVYRAKSGRYHARADIYGYAMSKSEDMVLISKDGTWVPFCGLDLYRTISSIYDAMFTHRWKKGDIILVDNIRFAHARLDGRGENRSIRFLHYGPADRSFHLNNLERL